MDNYSDEDLHDAGESLYDNGEYEKAIEIFTEALDSEKKHRSFYLRAFCYYYLNEYYKALEDMDAAIGIDDEYADYFAIKGVLHEKLNQPEEALIAFDRNVKLSPSAHNYQNRAIMHKRMGEYDKAIDDYTSAIDLSDNSSQLYVSRSTVYRLMNDLDKVWEDLNRAIEEDPENISIYLDTTELYITTECYKDGYKYVTRHEEKISKTGNGRDKLLFLYLKAILCVCLNISIESFEGELTELSKEDFNLEWNFSHTEKWLETSGLREDKKEKIEELNELFK